MINTHNAPKRGLICLEKEVLTYGKLNRILCCHDHAVFEIRQNQIPPVAKGAALFAYDQRPSKQCYRLHTSDGLIFQEDRMATSSANR